MSFGSGDFVKLFDDDNTGEMLIDDMEFHKAMKTRFGFRGTPWVLDEVFKSIDTDGSGEIGFDRSSSSLCGGGGTPSTDAQGRCAA